MEQYGNSVSFVRSLYPGFHSGCASPHFDQQGIMPPFSASLLAFVLTVVRRNLKVLSIIISPVAKGMEHF